jgi:hypothetical protein
MDNCVGLPIQLVMEVQRQAVVAPVRRECEHQGDHREHAEKEELRGAAYGRVHVRSRPRVVEWRR